MELQKNNINIAIITNKRYSNCETFIKAQIDNLPFNSFQYWGESVPFQLMSHQKNSFAKRALNKIRAKRNSEEILLKDLKKNNIRLVLAHYGMMGTLMLNLCQKLNLPLVVHFHGHDAVRKSILQKYSEEYQKMFLYPKIQVISVSHKMTERLVQLGCPVDKIIYNTYGPNVDFIKLTPHFTKKQFVYIGRFVEKKAPHLLLLSFKQLVGKHPDYSLIMAGDGPLLDSCKTLSKSLQIETAVHFPGRVTPKIYMSYLSESLSYVQHSIEAEDGDMEGTPVSILEASAAGIPVISTKHAGIPDVILHQQTGLLSRELDIDSMTRNMEWVIENRNEAIEMGRKGKEHIKTNFSIKKHLKGIENIIKSNI